MTVTKAAEWRKNREEGVELTLPSGNTARIRAVSTDFFIKVGRVPNFLTPLVLKSLESNGLKKDDLPKQEEIESTKEWINMLDSFCEVAFVEPKVVKEPLPDSDQISVDDISYADKLFCFNFIGRPAKYLEFFCQREKELIQRLAAESSIPQAAEQTPELENVVQ